MKRSIPFLLVVALGVLLSATAVTADEHPPLHPHMLVIGVEYDGAGEPIGFKKCVDLAANQMLRLNAHHAHAHTGQAGAALEGAGHAVVPGSPLTPWANCEALIEAFSPSGG